MQGKLFICILLLLFGAGKLPAQCVEKDSLQNFLQSLITQSINPTRDQLAKLLSYNSRIKKCSYQNDSTHALLLRSIGDTYYRNADYLAAAQYYREAIAMIDQHKNKPSVNYIEQIKNYYLLSVVYESLDNVAQQMTALDSCASIAIRMKSIDRPCLWALYSRAQFFFDVGDFRRCIEFAELCEFYGKEYANRGPGKIYGAGLIYASSSLHWHVNALLELKNYSAAEKLLINRLEESKKKINPTNMGILYGQLAEVQAHNNDLNKSIGSFRQAYKTAWANKDTVDCMSILNNIGYFIYHKNNRNIDSAIFYYRKALNLLKKGATVSKYGAIESLNIFNGIASAFVDKGMFDSGFKYFQLAFDQIKLGIDESGIVKGSLDDLNSQRKIKYLANLMIDKGVAYQKRYKATGEKKYLENAIRVYKLADKFLDKVKHNIFDTDSKLSWLSHSRRLYEHSIDACNSVGNMAEAFYFFEKSRAVLLNDQLAEQRWLGEADILRQTQCKKRIAQLERESLEIDKTSKDYKIIQEELYFNRQDLDSLVSVIKAKNPFYFQNFLDTGTVTLKDVKEKVLLNHNALIEIFSGDSSVFVLAIEKNRISLFRVKKAIYDSLCRTYISYVSDPILLNQDYRGFTSVSNRLFKLLFGNLELPRGRIIISPDGHYFPFESLITGHDIDAPAYFIDQYAVSYTYSARYLLNNFNSNRSNVKDFIGMAPVQYNGRLGLSTLPGSDGSLQRLKAYFRDAENLISVDASKSNFLRNYNQYRIVQLYTHATDNGLNGEPIIWFADSALLLSELIYEARPASQLIVLSACETAKGKLYEGEGVFSFNRGFAAIGIPSSISNLWSVDNESTYRVTELFYKYLSNGDPIDVALQKAKIEFVKTASRRNKLPYYWAAPVLIGMNNSIETQKVSSWSLWMIIMWIAVVLILVTYRGFSTIRSQERISKALADN